MKHKIAILGDFNPAHSTLLALNESTVHIRNSFREEIEFDWVPSDRFEYRTAFNDGYCGLWIAPGSPYIDMENVINSIRFVRENNIPAFGNCGGFQHMVIEFARNVCGIINADHEETNPGSSNLVISELPCTLKEQEEVLTITDTNSIIYGIVKKRNFIGRYFCSYGINPDYTDILKSKGLKFTASSDDESVRVLELPSNRFYLGTLFQPALSSTITDPDPLILEFVKQCIGI